MCKEISKRLYLVYFDLLVVAIDVFSVVWLMEFSLCLVI